MSEPSAVSVANRPPRTGADALQPRCLLHATVGATDSSPPRAPATLSSNLLRAVCTHQITGERSVTRSCRALLRARGPASGVCIWTARCCWTSRAHYARTRALARQRRGWRNYDGGGLKHTVLHQRLSLPPGAPASLSSLWPGRACAVVLHTRAPALCCKNGKE